jgi:hypothetical protein
VAGFLWLDKLGVGASQGIDVVVRQSLYGGHYALIKDDLSPTPVSRPTVIYNHQGIQSKFIIIAQKYHKIKISLILIFFFIIIF